METNPQSIFLYAEDYIKKHNYIIKALFFFINLLAQMVSV